MTRAQYNAERRARRAANDTRAERGLPHHLDGSGLAPCHCGKEGCSRCGGSTYVADGYRDPLLRMKYARQFWVRRRNPEAYKHARLIAMVPCWKLRLMDAAVGCEVACNRAVQAMRNAA